MGDDKMLVPGDTASNCRDVERSSLESSVKSALPRIYSRT
jgi:hypothetical protein